MLDGSVSVAKITEIVNICRAKERTGGKGMNWGISPLQK